ncbi:formylglycine-generating enzyme family protein [Streptomyces sp. SID3343]|uniref:formylglycine-generating enzyme family protein n=1 Tax=Streptomyces sp. SID3343 TaxID=2690260 RepID=UPI00136D7127|nr:formylglycine-generating enzyme family protein [Streptomyces sp. SID3343]MYW05576.1 SUMF1/EgtB/PvdO family nonheme iron enzyme [Streptomyces sp. SID3343]
MTSRAPGAGSPCCAPARGREAVFGSAPSVGAPTGPFDSHPDTGLSAHGIEQVLVRAQTILMGDSHGDGHPADGESPVHEVETGAFLLDATSVTNDAFRRFAEATGYVTDAERFGFSAVFHLAYDGPPEAVIGPAQGTPWWLGVRGADWAHPAGPGSDLTGSGDHPVVHVSWNDARAYCDWTGRRLPTEAEWETAARAGIPGARYPWGDHHDDRTLLCNIWHGVFPTRNTSPDGHLTTAPVRSYEPSAYGLWQMVGNVWEWCADWWSADYYAHSPRRDPRGPAQGRTRVMRGGSYLCHDSYCSRYRNAARSSNTPDSSMGNTGFRTAATAESHSGSEQSGRHRAVDAGREGCGPRAHDS